MYLAFRVTFLLYSNGNDSKPKENIVLVLKTQFSKDWAGHGGERWPLSCNWMFFFIILFFYYYEFSRSRIFSWMLLIFFHYHRVPQLKALVSFWYLKIQTEYLIFLSVPSLFLVYVCVCMCVYVCVCVSVDKNAKQKCIFTSGL